MPEPSGRAAFAGEIVPGVFRWTMHDDRIDFESDSYAVVQNGGVVLIDPLPMEEGTLERLGSVEAICLTASCHERAAWRLRGTLNVPVWGPSGGVDFEETPDKWYGAQDILPGNLQALHAPGPTDAHYALYLDRHQGILFCGDLLINPGGKLGFVPDDYQDEPDQTRQTVRNFLDWEFEVLCPDHGDPILQGARQKIVRIFA